MRMMNNVIKMDTTTTRQKSTNNSGSGGGVLNYILRGSKNSANDDVFQLFIRRIEIVVDDDGVEKRAP